MRDDKQDVIIYKVNYTKESKMKKLTLLSLAAMILMVSILGCNAARGVGRDISDSGRHIENIGK